MAIVNDTPDDEIPNATASRQLPSSWEQAISRIAGIGILNFLHPINNYDQLDATNQINEADFFFEYEEADEFVEDWETTTIFDLGWRCQC